MLTGSTPIFAVADVPEAIRFYTDVLGFQTNWMWGDPPTFGGVSWGNIALTFNLQPDIAARMEGHTHSFAAEDVDTLYAQHRQRGAEIVSPIENKPWDTREYTIRDPNGYHLRFGGNPSYTPRGVQGSAEGVRIERRIPTLEEYRRVVGEAFYKDVPPESYVARTWAGVVAADPGGQVIGTTRIMYDAPGWFSIWDVAVIPEWQHRRIGTRLMQEALAIIREESPGAFAYLFTTKQGFYERLGFANSTVQMCKV